LEKKEHATVNNKNERKDTKIGKDMNKGTPTRKSQRLAKTNMEDNRKPSNITTGKENRDPKSKRTQPNTNKHVHNKHTKTKGNANEGKISNKQKQNKNNTNNECEIHSNTYKENKTQNKPIMKQNQRETTPKKQNRKVKHITTTRTKTENKKMKTNKTSNTTLNTDIKKNTTNTTSSKIPNKTQHKIFKQKNVNQQKKLLTLRKNYLKYYTRQAHTQTLNAHTQIPSKNETKHIYKYTNTNKKNNTNKNSKHLRERFLRTTYNIHTHINSLPKTYPKARPKNKTKHTNTNTNTKNNSNKITNGLNKITKTNKPKQKHNKTKQTYLITQLPNTQRIQSHLAGIN